MRIPLGAVVKDSITGFEGKAIGRTEWVTGCATVTVQPRVDKEGKIPESRTIDEPTLEVVKAPKEPNLGPIPGGGG